MKQRTRSSDPSLLFLLALAGISGLLPAQAATWIVEHDPEQPEGRIGAVVAQAASGDTIVIGPGLYYEHIEVAQMELTLIGRDGAGATVLDGSRPAAPEAGAIVYNGPLGPDRSLKLVGLTFQHGQGCLMMTYFMYGGAVCWVGDLTAAECVFRENQLHQGYSYGGAVFVAGEHVEVSGCRFDNNSTIQAGGSIDAFGPTNFVLRDCVFEANIWTSGSVQLQGPYDGVALIEDCTFRASGGQSYYTAYFRDVDVVLRGNRFEDAPPNGGGTQIGFGHVHSDGEPTDILIEDNEFVGGPAPWVSYIHIQRAATTLTVRGNTFHRLRFQSAWLQNLVLERNIISEASVNFRAGQDIRLLCNAVWPESLDVGPPSVISENYGNLFVDPLLCDPENGDLTLQSNSPCAPNNSPAGCGLIGACPVGCEGVPVEKITWSRLKWWMLEKANRFRR